MEVKDLIEFIFWNLIYCNKEINKYGKNCILKLFI